MMSLNEAKSLVDQATHLGVRKIILSGGEPLVYPSLVELVEYIRQYDLQVVLYTSGSAFDSGNNPVSVPQILLHELIERGVKRFNLSLHSHRAAIHDQFMNTTGSWQRAVDFLHRSIQCGGDVHIHTVITRLNFDTISQLIFFLDDKRIGTLRLLRLVPQGRARINFHKLDPTEADWLFVRRELEDLSQNRNLSIKVRLGAHLAVITNQRDYECTLDDSKLLIEPDGSVSVCPALKGARTFVGAPNAFREPILEILQSQWRRKVSSLKQESSITECPAQELYREITMHKQSNYGG